MENLTDEDGITFCFINFLQHCDHFIIHTLKIKGLIWHWFREDPLTAMEYFHCSVYWKKDIELLNILHAKKNMVLLRSVHWMILCGTQNVSTRLLPILDFQSKLNYIDLIFFYASWKARFMIILNGLILYVLCLCSAYIYIYIFFFT